MVFDGLPRSTHLVEVGLRDGLQAVSEVLSTDRKLEILNDVLDAGFTTVEITSFAHPKVLPQFADAERVIAEAPRRDGVRYKSLVPNLRGAQRACATGIDEIVAVIPVDPGMAMKNQNATPERLMADFDEIVIEAHRAGKTVSAAIATAFFSPCRGAVDAAELDHVVTRVVDAGADSLYLAGTSGMETPTEFASGLHRVKRRCPGLPVGVHLHNRNGFAAVNALASLAAGADWLEGSFGGLGGDMWFPGDPSVLGNAPTEDLVTLFDSFGITTGIDLGALMAVVEKVESYTGTPSYSFVSRGGTRQQLADAQWPV
ncbi:hydroxymethylglutaryl-CoA lyase [Rhodococcus sp. BP-149]|uniref:hydroxymethylglutaryl-CoA lyase n=1 Tax=unclassified Rhodococcus (in: high G+C Gram-positive bacteria) TaxID=192944 RepID=UPI001C9AE4BC|nr:MULTISPECIES: hydroxymethylglutaryl-CoA lyase [unclassified Rhodococcus (in: high G+C Gram-positive bacteria)]MBY6683931.1 hydroxymethylglutaryl-CoA lyase [Rhodococcus sp. BP-288]MBY6693408.1 hydroxymethylglutaryl-CoA lyase [Rhodococcus sp. BP-188]MBY6697605.1 hydroxymethylglutaryl-CoA lyase [Rhodococcus sp. BP-285]MBY6702282.1 hydroxymethylglutaryl-CoA lyase [Rhodococcus sp. BP-283]MBY6709785.1 hydroxymethylglutaryl-CoA lyase [Rhodococcus sp. BP-160]